MKNEKTRKRKAGEERRQADFKETACCPSAVVQGAAWRKTVKGRPTVILIQPKRGSGPHHHIEAAFDWCSSILLTLHVHTMYTTEISHFTIHRDWSQYVFCGRTEGP